MMTTTISAAPVQGWVQPDRRRIPARFRYNALERPRGNRYLTPAVRPAACPCGDKSDNKEKTMKHCAITVTGMILALAVLILAQAPEKMPAPSAEHKRLASFLGKWTSEG